MIGIKDMKKHKTVKVRFSNLESAAKEIAKETNAHFNNPKHGWDLCYHGLVTEVFYRAFGHHLEDYLHEALKGKYLFTYATSDLVAIKNGKFVVRKNKNVKNRKRKTNRKK